MNTTVMNVELKALVDIIFDGINLTEDLVSVNYSKVISDAISLFEAAPQAIQNISDFLPEIVALSGSEQEQDLIAYIETKIQMIPSVTAQSIFSIIIKVITDLVTIIEDILNLKKLIKKN